MNLNNLNLSELVDLQADVAFAIEEKRKEEKAEVLEELKALANARGFDMNDLVRGRGAAKKVAAKYRNPSDPSQTWAGRGRKPNWLVSALASGKSLDSFAI